MTEENIKYRDAFPKEYDSKSINAAFDKEYDIHKRNEVLEEVALEMEKFTFAFGVDTVHSFTAFVRSMKS